MVEREKAEKRDRETEREEREEKSEVKSLFFNAAIQGGPASGDTIYVERRRYIAACVPTCGACQMSIPALR
jgi:hypothetical protein